ncbi:MAG TPA: hypothetical protein VGO47_06230 [Chlamydiales bacterium]|nr:hypothetical protein [Chlamydiales bacterium]
MANQYLADGAHAEGQLGPIGGCGGTLEFKGPRSVILENGAAKRMSSWCRKSVGGADHGCWLASAGGNDDVGSDKAKAVGQGNDVHRKVSL